MLKVLYNVVEQKPQRVYIILITLLILTNDESFCAAVQTLVSLLYYQRNKSTLR